VEEEEEFWGGDVLSARVVCLVFLSWVLGLS
jgi:hypothetical protein